MLRAFILVSFAGALTASALSAQTAEAPERALVAQYCVACHNSSARTAGLALDAPEMRDIAASAEVWEKVARRLRARQMPPAGLPRPDEAGYRAALDSLEGALDRAAAERPNPGRTDTFRRLNRTEYRNAVRDLLAVDVDVAALLPADESSRGFDNVTVADLSPTLLDRYLAAAEKIARLAVGRPVSAPGGHTEILPADLTQERRIDGLPVGTRGGGKFVHTFPLDAEYEFQVRLARDRNEHVDGLFAPAEVELLLDGRPIRSFEVLPPRSPEGHETADAHLKVRVPVRAGPRTVAATFVAEAAALLESERQPYQARFNFYRHPRQQPAIYSISVLGPYGAAMPGDTPSRRRIFLCRPEGSRDEEDCAGRIVAALARRAWRRPVSEADLGGLLRFFREGREESGFEAGVERAVAAVLMSPEFLFRVERDPEGAAPGAVYALDDFALASRLAFFLWSSIPDDELLDAAERGQLSRPEGLRRQARRMLADERSRTLATNFAGQWLHLRRLDAASPDMREFPDFDDNLRQAMRRETELFFESIQREDRPVVDLLRADYTFLDERLAKHYGVPHVYGARFRRVDLGPGTMRGGLLRHGSILTVTSYANRTSPVIRGNWVLENILGVPPPPPPPNVPALDEGKIIAKNLSVRERLAEHRKNPACSGCHQLMDPIGFSLENYDAVGRWRTREAGKPLDVSGGLPDGSTFDGVDGLERALIARPEIFAGVLTEKLLTYALGRGVEPFDAPAVREILRKAKTEDYRFSSIVLGVVESAPFRMRRAS